MGDERPTRRQGEEGFTIVELLVAMSLFGIVLTGVTGAFISAIRSVDSQRLRTAATRVAIGRLETLRGLPFTELDGQAGETTVTTPDGRAFPVLTEVTPIDAVTGAPLVVPSPIAVKQITVTVRWSSRGASRSVSYSTAIAPEEIDPVSEAQAIGTVTMFPSPATIDDGGRLLEDVEVAVPLVGFPPTTLVLMSWINADGRPGAKTLMATGDGNWRGTIVPSELVGVLKPDGRREVQFEVRAGALSAAYTLVLQVAAASPPQITLAIIDRNPITVDTPTGTTICAARNQCLNTTVINFTVTATGLDPRQDTVILQYQLDDRTLQEVPLAPELGLWRLTVAPNTTKFLVGPSRTFRFTAIRSADGAVSAATVVRDVASV